MNEPAVYKQDKSRFQRLLRGVVSAINPRAYLHAFKLLNYYRYTHVDEIRKMTRGKDVRISPTVSLSNGLNIVLGDHVRIGSRCTIWAGQNHGRIIFKDHAMLGPNILVTAANYRFNDGSPVTSQPMDEADIVVGCDVWIGADVVVLPGVTIGDGAIIGAGAVLRSDVAPGSVVVGAASQVAGRRSIIGVDQDEAVQSHFAAIASPDVGAWLLNDGKLTPYQLAAPIDECGLDSFELITLRTALEQAFDVVIPDRVWASLERIEDVARLAVLTDARRSRSNLPSRKPEDPAVETVEPPANRSQQAIAMGRAARSFSLNMPQMALAGLSESWIFKELGDLHWSMICQFLGTSSGSISDETGSRLYATFTRICFEADPSLRAFNENDPLEMDSKLERFGASFFFGEHKVASPHAGVRARTMSTFAKYGERGKNTSLMKGAPTLPDPDAIRSLSEFPLFGTEYRERRSGDMESEPLFECEYEQIGPHDINGVGLLYFAAYPIIFDICVGKFEGPEFLLSHSTVSKDVCYFANAEPTETLIFRINQRDESADEIRYTTSLSRKSDGKRMAEIVGIKRHVGLHIPQ